jgi:hypothetical protein
MQIDLVNDSRSRETPWGNKSSDEKSGDTMIKSKWTDTRQEIQLYSQCQGDLERFREGVANLMTLGSCTAAALTR